MANDMNQCNFTGRLGRDPEVRFTQSGTAVANINLAVGKQWRDKNSGQKQEDVNWARLVAFGKTAELAQQHLKKGDQIRVTCEFQERKFQDQNGQDRYITEFVIREMQFLGSPNQGQGGYQQRPPQGGQRQTGGQPQTGGHPQGGAPQQTGGQPHPYGPPQGNNAGPGPGAYDDFDDEIPFAPYPEICGG